MTNEENLLEEVTAEIGHCPSCPASILRRQGACECGAVEQAQVIVPLIQKDLIKRMMGPNEGMLDDAGQTDAAQHTNSAISLANAHGWCAPKEWKNEPPISSLWKTMLRTFATENGIEIE